MYCIVLYLMIVLLGISKGAHVVLLPIHVRSHLAYLLAVGEGLIDRGHRVSLLIAENYPVPVDAVQYGVHVINFQMPGVDVNAREKQRSLEIINYALSPNSDQINVVLKLSKYATEQCEFMVKDHEIHRKLANADYFLLDGTPMAPCLAMIPVAMGIPFGKLATQYDPLQTRTPVLPSINPISLLPQTDKLTFNQRMTNLLFCLSYSFKWNINRGQDALFWQYLPEKAKEIGTIQRLSQQANLFLYNQDPIMDYPRLAWPNTIFVGGLNARPPKPLPDAINHFLNKATDGVVVISFGSIATYLPNDINDKLLETFRRLPMKVLWRYTGPKLTNIPDNVMTQPWIPQNDILGHNNTRVFVTHCGNGGLYEALYHAVPMVGFPIFADQPYQALKLKHKGFGVLLSLLDFTPNELHDAILEVAQNPVYHDNIRRASLAHRAQSHPRDRAAEWVEHVIAHGNHFRRPVVMDMPFYQVIMLDVIAVIAAGAAVTAALIYCILRQIYHRCFKIEKKLKVK